jgi:NADH:ubiquinone oxidoreductase subunit E
MDSATDNLGEIIAESRKALPAHILAYIEEVMKGPEPHSQLISVLHKVQGHFGYLAKEQLDAVAQLLRIPQAKVTGVATFYHFFRLKPRGRFMINVCLGTACYVKGASDVAERFKEDLGIDFGETSGDGMFSLESSRCLGTCGLAPVVMIEGEVHAKVKPAQVPALLDKYRAIARGEHS